jgi:hypothetical protein
MKKKPNDTVEFPDDVEIEGGADYDFADPTAFAGKDPGMRYFFAADDKDAARPDGVAALERRGYRRSEKKHHHPDCVLMEIPIDIHKKRQAAAAKRNRKLVNAATKLPPGLEKVGDRHGVESKE